LLEQCRALHEAGHTVAAASFSIGIVQVTVRGKVHLQRERLLRAEPAALGCLAA